MGMMNFLSGKLYNNLWVAQSFGDIHAYIQTCKSTKIGLEGTLT